MKLQIERKYVEAMVDEFPGLAALKDQLRFGNKAEVPFKQLSNTELSYLQILYQKAGSEMQGHAAQLSTLQKAMNDDTVKFEEDDLEMPRIHIINATPLKKGRWYSFRLPKQKTKEVSHENIQPSNPRRKHAYPVVTG
jgi:hypothetical protein